ncbi:MAG: DNA integrity scanning protein DisA nucleotide-binding domain protein [Flavobacteriales bacterium]|nr:DNA integrity scanning protein DisA nucleotide-binding domain protein [Flavobacteriales bacterium]
MHFCSISFTINSDAVAIVVSEQTGGISIAHEDNLEHDISPKKFRAF